MYSCRSESCEILQGTFLGIVKLMQKINLFLRSPFSAQLYGRNTVSGNTKRVRDDKKEKQPNMKPGTTFHRADKDVRGVQL